MASSLGRETANVQVPPPQLSFTGRLDMENFKFKSETQSPPVAAGQTPPRRSTRLLTTTSRLGSPTRVMSTSSSSTAKRKAAALADGDDEDDDAMPALPNGSTDSSSSSAPTPGSTNKARNKSRDRNRNRPKSGYQPPSVYAHLPPLPDALGPNMFVLLCGLNPGIRTATTGHAYNHPSNLFWKLMYSSGVLPEPCAADEDRSLPGRFRLGLTNIVSRPSRNSAELSKAEMDVGVGALEDKVRRWRPEVVCMVGKGIWESVWRVRHGGKGIAKHQFRYGWQDESENMGLGRVEDGERQEGVEYHEGWRGARVFVSSSTSGLAATLSPAEKERIWRELGQWVKARRLGRDVAPGLVRDLS